MNSKDFYDWKRHPVTQAVISQLSSRVTECKEILADQAGQNPAFDRELVGAIKAYNDLINISWEDTATEVET